MDYTATSAVFGWDKADVAEYRRGAGTRQAERCDACGVEHDLTPAGGGTMLCGACRSTFTRAAVGTLEEV